MLLKPLPENDGETDVEIDRDLGSDSVRVVEVDTDCVLDSWRLAETENEMLAVALTVVVVDVEAERDKVRECAADGVTDSLQDDVGNTERDEDGVLEPVGLFDSETVRLRCACESLAVLV